MNIETLSEGIREFNANVVESGFKRDVLDYINSLGANQNNILSLRDIANKLRDSLTVIYSTDLVDALTNLFPEKRVRPFTETDFIEKVTSLIDDKEVSQDQFYQRINQILNDLHTKIDQNEKEIDRINTFISPYVKEEEERLTEEGKALMSLIFKDRNTIGNLSSFTRTLTAWNRVLPLYHQILKSETPDGIEIVEVQNGSIDLIINLDVDVALDLVELFKVGFKCYAAYLSYKHMLKPITDSYFGNKKLIESEEEREKELLKNIGLAIENEAKKQHELAMKSCDVSNQNPDKTIEQVTNLVSSHIVNGNDIKLLTEHQEEIEEDSLDSIDHRRELRSAAIEAKKAVRMLKHSEMQKLLDVYGDIKDEH